MIYIALIGLTLIIVRGTIFGPLQRLWPALFGCAQCTGMWVGMAAGVLKLTTITGDRIDILLIGGATSVLSLLTDAILVMLLGDPG